VLDIGCASGKLLKRLTYSEKFTCLVSILVVNSKQGRNGSWCKWIKQS